jgi:catechol 2,3-dioxygenase-like lactoylglutathione lyase family enzyme
MNIKGLHHYAYRCRDAEETRHFYEDILGLPLTHVIRMDHVPSTGEHCPYVHVFFQMGDGSYIAFFDLGDNVVPAPSPNTPSWVNHLALEMETEEELVAAKKRLEEAGIQVLGITDHHIIRSIYFFDPNGIRLELTVKAIEEEEMKRLGSNARQQLDNWTTEKTISSKSPTRPQPVHA